MAENLIRKLIPHQGCVITPIDDGIQIAGSAMNWVMSAGVTPFVCRPPFAFRVVGIPTRQISECIFTAVN